MNDFSSVNAAIKALTPAIPSEVLSGISSGVVRIGQKAASAISEYSSLYAQNQLLKYDEDGDPSDVTTDDRKSIANSSIANAVRELVGIRDQYSSLMQQLPVKSETVVVTTAVDESERIIWFDAIPVGSIVNTDNGYTTLIYIRVGLQISGTETNLVFMKSSDYGVLPVLPSSTYPSDALLNLLSHVMFPTIAGVESSNVMNRRCIPLLFSATCDIFKKPFDLMLIPMGSRNAAGYENFKVGSLFRTSGESGMWCSNTNVDFGSVPFDTVLLWSQLPFTTSSGVTSGGSGVTSHAVREVDQIVVGGKVVIAPQPSVSGIIDTSLEASHTFDVSYVPNQLDEIDNLIATLQSL